MSRWIRFIYQGKQLNLNDEKQTRASAFAEHFFRSDYIGEYFFIGIVLAGRRFTGRTFIPDLVFVR